MNVSLVQMILENIFAHEDYDLFKTLKGWSCDGGDDEFPEIAEKFVALYATATGG